MTHPLSSLACVAVTSGGIDWAMINLLKDRKLGMAGIKREA